ncbi:prokineticin receptor 2-like [Oppia nitens]|uniref:prokineticin receptor 2-like n=1 Tax=Oppia nitens TaxID=1686743 RepID=UPI0023DB1735|nr:prokineticin receptor 2-like [Oppia nitens]
MKSQMKHKSRPKALMANIALSDTILTVNTLIPRFVLMRHLIDNNNNPTIGAYILQSFHNYLDNITLFSTSHSMILIACDRYYAITHVFNNPLDKYCTRHITLTTWLCAIILSVPFALTNDVDYFNFTNNTLYCMKRNDTYLNDILSNRAYTLSTRIFGMSINFIVPTLLVTWFTTQMINALVFSDNITQHHVSGRKVNRYFTVKSQSPCGLTPGYYFFYVTFRTTNSLNSVIFFWLSSSFRKQCFQLFKTKDNTTTSRMRTSSTEILFI